MLEAEDRLLICHPNLDLYLYPNRYLHLNRYQVLTEKRERERGLSEQHAFTTETQQPQRWRPKSA